MALKDTWVDKKNNDDYIDANDINMVAGAVIELEENPDTYSKDDIDTLLSKKRDNDDFTPIASADKVQETISLVGITTVETSDEEKGWEITSNTLSANFRPVFSDGVIFHIDFQGNVNLEIDANAFEDASSFYPDRTGYVEIDGIKLTAENVSMLGCKYRYNGDITRGIIIKARYARYEFATFIKNIKIYSDGFMSSEQVEKLQNTYTKEEVDEFLTEKATVTETDRRLYSVPSAGLDIVDGVVVGIGSCRDEHIVIPEVDGEGNDVYAVADGVFGTVLVTKYEFIKSITFPPSVKWLGGEFEMKVDVIHGATCPNLEAVYILNSKIDWAKSPISPFKLPGTTKDVYFGGTRKQWLELNTGRALIKVTDENLAAGIVPTLHYGYFAASSEVERLEKSFANLEENVGSIGTALDAILAIQERLDIQESIVGGVEQ